MDLISGFNGLLSEKLGVNLRSYQVHVIKDLLSAIGSGSRFIVVSMPTGSGKTFIELFMAYWALRKGTGRVLVIEPTRFLCDQMYSKLWSRVFVGSVGKEYEGECSSFIIGRDVVVSTPQTSLKCINYLGLDYSVVVIDEVHHAFGSGLYKNLIGLLRPRYVFGFTALVPSRKKRFAEDFKEIFGDVNFLNYDFKTLSSLDNNFELPKAILDFFDAEFDKLEDRVYTSLVFRRGVSGNPKAISRLPTVLVKYGRESFCESLYNALAKGDITSIDVEVEKLCKDKTPSHKARTIVNVLKTYGISDFKPILIFTTRKKAAEGIRDAIVRSLGVSSNRVVVLTGDLDKEERKRIIHKASQGLIDIIISTRVGEEGIDIPEAGLLVMADLTPSEIRFYQRLGRLLRLSSKEKIKYLIVTPTPKTREYHSLTEAIENLKIEGVDVSFLIIDIKGKGIGARLTDMVKDLIDETKRATISFTELLFKKTWISSTEAIKEILQQNPHLISKAKQALIQPWVLPDGTVFKEKPCREEELKDIDSIAEKIAYYMSSYIIGAKALKKLFESIEKTIIPNNISNLIQDAIYNRQLSYIYDPELLSDFIAPNLVRAIKQRLEERQYYPKDITVAVNRKILLVLTMRFFPYENKDKIIKMLNEIVEVAKNNIEGILEQASMQKNINIEYDIHVNSRIYRLNEKNEKNKLITAKIYGGLNINNTYIPFMILISYYYFKSLKAANELKDLVEANLEAIAYKTVLKLLNELLGTE